MAKKQDQGARTTLEEVNESLTSAAQRIEDNKKYINWALIAIAVLALLAGGYLHLRNSGIEDAKKEIGDADIELLQGQEDEALKAYEKVAAEYGNKPGERAHLNAAIILYQKGEYEKAISMSGDNEMYTPAFMLKKATVLHEQKKYAEEAAIYQTIKDKYPVFGQQSGFNVDKYLERANALAGK